jgi:hypothetical protein
LVWWALRTVGVEEWLVKVIQAVYEGVNTAVKVAVRESEAFPVKVGVHQGSVLSLLLFIVVMEALSREIRGVGLPWELLHADDLLLMADSEDKPMKKLIEWKSGFEEKGLRENVRKAKVIRCAMDSGVQRESGKFPCSICMKGVGSNSICCGACGKWVHKKCSRVKGRLKAQKDYQCSNCRNTAARITVTKTGERKKYTELETEVTINCVDEFCYLGDMLSSGGVAEEASRTWVKCGLKNSGYSLLY